MFPYTAMPILNTYPHNQDVWMSLVVSLFYLVILNAPILYMAVKFRGLTINQIFEVISGSFMGKAICIIFVMLFIMCYLVCLLVALVFVNVILMPATPMWALILLAIAPITYTAIKGAGVIGRVATIIVPLIMATIIIFGFAGFNLMDFDNIKPILADSSFLDINKGAFLTAARFSEINVFLVFGYFLRKDQSITKSYFITIITSIAFFLIMLLSTLLVLGYDISSRAVNAYYIFTRQVQFYPSIEKIQVINVFVWFPGSLLKLAIYNYMASFVLSNIFKKVSRKKFVILVSVFVFMVSMIPAVNNTLLLQYLQSDKFFPFAILGVCFVIPLLLLVKYLFSKKKVDAKYAEMLDGNNMEEGY